MSGFKVQDLGHAEGAQSRASAPHGGKRSAELVHAFD